MTEGQVGMAVGVKPSAPQKSQDFVGICLAHTLCQHQSSSQRAAYVTVPVSVFHQKDPPSESFTILHSLSPFFGLGGYRSSLCGLILHGTKTSPSHPAPATSTHTRTHTEDHNRNMGASEGTDQTTKLPRGSNM